MKIETIFGIIVLVLVMVLVVIRWNSRTKDPTAESPPNDVCPPGYVFTCVVRPILSSSIDTVLGACPPTHVPTCLPGPSLQTTPFSS